MAENKKINIEDLLTKFSQSTNPHNDQFLSELLTHYPPLDKTWSTRPLSTEILLSRLSKLQQISSKLLSLSKS